MITADSDLRAVLSQYPPSCRPRGTIEYLGGAGGYSGAQFWRFAALEGPLLLRQWPIEHPTIERLQFIQAVLWHVHQEGFHLVPLPLETVRHAGFVLHAGHLWELAPWMPGSADFHANPTPRRLRSAMQTLAGFHQAAASFPLPDSLRAESPGLRQRWQQLEELRSGGLAELERRIDPIRWPDLAERATRLLRLVPAAMPRVAQQVRQALDQRAPLTPCLRDIWHDHVLFEGDHVSALVDFGALRAENVAGDVARLLGSLVADDAASWQAGLADYEAIRPLSAVERQWVKVFDASSVLLSGLNWLQWVFVEGRQFENRDPILARLDTQIERLTHFLQSGPP